MILHLTQGMSMLALRIKEIGSMRQVISWEDLQLLIQPGQHDAQSCYPNGSPWILTGCWPGKRTGVDVANWRPDFPTIVYPAYKLDAEGRVVFHLDERLWELPTGRYTGILRAAPIKQCYDFPHVLLSVAPPPPDRGIPQQYLFGRDCCVDTPPDVPPRPEPKCCILSTFDIDLGPMCSDHMIDQVSVDFKLDTCGVEDG